MEEGKGKNSGAEERLRNFQEVEIEIKGLVAANKMLMDYQKESRKSKKKLYNIIITLIICMMLEAGMFIGAFCWYEAQFEYADYETVTTTTEYSKDMTTSGDNANINNVEGNQYNNDAVHNDNK